MNLGQESSAKVGSSSNACRGADGGVRVGRGGASGAPEAIAVAPAERTCGGLLCTVAAPAVGGGRGSSLDCKVRYIPFVPCLT